MSRVATNLAFRDAPVNWLRISDLGGQLLSHVGEAPRGAWGNTRCWYRMAVGDYPKKV